MIQKKAEIRAMGHAVLYADFGFFFKSESYLFNSSCIPLIIRDCSVTEGNGWLLARAVTQSSKGIDNRYRRPKLAYNIVKKYF
ncbi:hypothetical protein [Paenibacillus sp. sgz302251]|uniref:hypothetical protein n=1 Tax=Paenibacillus sp. sgz302251 TaxID=3414493 RepID=UPI003C7BCB0B